MSLPSYLDNVLRPQLDSLGLNLAARELVVADIGARLGSLANNWDDEPFRRTALLFGLELGMFYAPHSAPVDVRAAVAVGVRNSMLTELNASEASVPDLRPYAGRLRDEDMPGITGSAIAHFSSAPLGPVPGFDSREDVFRRLSERFPVAWAALRQVATSGSRSGPVVPLESGFWSTCETGQAAATMPVVVESGYSVEIDEKLGAMLQHVCAAPGRAFVVPYFKFLSRNPEKVLRAIEMLLRAGSSFATANYLVAPDYFSVRERLKRPAHFADEAVADLADCNALGRRHRLLIKSYLA